MIVKMSIEMNKNQEKLKQKTCNVAHWNFLFIASETLISIFGP